MYEAFSFFVPNNAHCIGKIYVNQVSGLGRELDPMHRFLLLSAKHSVEVQCLNC